MTYPFHMCEKVTKCGNNFAITSAGIGEALQRSASALYEAGNTIDESIALVTAGNAVIQNPEQVGTALKTLALRLRGTKTELEEAGLETDSMAESTAQLQAKLKALTHGKVDIMVDANTFKNSTQVLREMAGAWKDMTDIERSAALELMGGKRQANILASIIKNFDTVEKVIATSQNSAGSALKENEVYLDSIQGKLDQLSNSTQTMWMNFMRSDVVKFLISVATEIVKITDKVGLLNVAVAGFMAKTAFKSQKFGIGNLIYNKQNKVTIPTTSSQNTAEAAVQDQDTAATERNTAATNANIEAEQRSAQASAESAAADQAEAQATAQAANAETAEAAASAQSAAADATEAQASAQAAAADQAEAMASAQAAATDKTEAIQSAAAGAADAFEAAASAGATVVKTTQNIGSAVQSAATGITVLGHTLKTGSLAFKAFNAVATFGVSIIAGLAVNFGLKMWDAYIHRVENLKQEVKELTDEYENANKTFSKNIATLTTSSDTNTYKTLLDEFTELAAGVDQYGNNIGLTSSQYERYKAICDQIVGVNPKIAAGYDSNTKAIGNNVSMLSQLIELQKIQARQNAEEYLKDDNLEKIAADKYEDAKKAQEKLDDINFINSDNSRVAAEKLINKFFIDDRYKQTYGNNPEDVISNILKTMGYDDTDVEKILEKYADGAGSYNTQDFFKDFMPEIAQNKVKFTNIKDGTNLIHEFLEEVNYNYQDTTKYAEKVQDARDGLINTLLQVPIGSKDYDNLNDGTQKFITEWIKSSEQFKIPEGASEKDVKDLLKNSVNNVDAVISKLADPANQVTINGKQFTAQDVIDQIYNLDPSTVSWDKYKNQTNMLLDKLYESIGGEDNEFGIKRTDFDIAFGFNFQEIDDAKDIAIEQIAGFLKADIVDIQDNVNKLTADEIKILASPSIDWSGITSWQDVLDIIHSKMPDSTPTVKTYSQISEVVSKYNDVVTQSAEIVSDNTQVTQEYKDALIEAGFTTEELIECFGEENGLIVKNAQALKELTEAKKDEIATTIRLTRAHAELQYDEIIRSISEQIVLENNLVDADMEVVDSLLEQASALRMTINQYQLLESSLLGATNAFTQFSKAKEIDSQNTYGSTLVEMAQTMYDAIYKTGEVGSEAFWAAVKATVPDDIYMGLAPGEQQIKAISRYLQDNLFSGLTFSGDSFSIDYNSIEGFVKEAQSKGLFSGTDATVFGLSSTFTESLKDGENGLKKFAEQMGVTEEYAYAMFSEMDKYNSNGMGLSMLFQLDSSTTSQMTILNTQLEQALATRKRLIEQGADLSANTAEIGRIQSQQAKVKTKATDNTTKYLMATNALKDPNQKVQDVLSQELILEIGLDGEQTVESVFQQISDWLLQLEEPTVLDLQISQESIQNSLQELEDTFGKENLETELKIRNGVIDGDRNYNAISDEVLDRYSNLLNLDQYVDDALSTNLTTTESLLMQIAKNTGIMAGTEGTDNKTATSITQDSATSTVEIKVEQENPTINIDTNAKDAYRQYREIIDEMNKLDVDPTQTVFGNIDTNNRQVLEWTDESLNQYKDELQSWFKDENGISIPWDQIVGDLSGSISTVLGTSGNYDGVEIAFSPMLQTENGAVLLSADTVDKYIYGLIDKANPDGWTSEELLALDAEGLEIDGQKIKGLIADIGDTAIQTSQAMHFTGTDGAYAAIFDLITEEANKAGVTVGEWLDMMKTAVPEIEGEASNVGGIVQSMAFGLYKVKQAGVETYSTLQSQVSSYNDAVSQTEEIITNGTKVTADYKQSLIDLGISATELNACFDTTNGLIVKDIDTLNKLVGVAKKNTANNIKLAKSQAQLKYYELSEEMRTVIGTSEKLNAKQLATINRLYQEMSTVQSTIAKYSLLEAQLLGTANAYDRIAEAQQIDSAIDYGSKAEDLVSILGNAFNTGELGTEAARVAFEGLIPDSVIANATDFNDQMKLAYDYFTKGELSKLFTIKFNSDGGISGVEMTKENVQSYVENLIKQGKVFSGTWDKFELDPNIQSMEDFASALGVTEEVALALLTTLEKYDISWLGGDMETLIDQLMGDNLEYSIQKSTEKTASLLREKAKLLAKDKRSDDEEKRLAQINTELEAQNQIMQTNRETASAMWQEYSNSQDAAKALSGLSQDAKLSEEELNQIFAGIDEKTREQFGLKWDGNATVADYLERVRNMQLALGEPSELVLTLAQDDVESQIKEILGVDSLDDPIVLETQFRFNTETGEYDYIGDKEKELTDEQKKQLGGLYGDWTKLRNLLNLPTVEDYAKRSAEANERTANAVETMAGQKTEGSTGPETGADNTGATNGDSKETETSPTGPYRNAKEARQAATYNANKGLVDTMTSASTKRSKQNETNGRQSGAGNNPIITPQPGPAPLPSQIIEADNVIVKSSDGGQQGGVGNTPVITPQQTPAPKEPEYPVPQPLQPPPGVKESKIIEMDSSVWQTITDIASEGIDAITSASIKRSEQGVGVPSLVEQIVDWLTGDGEGQKKKPRKFSSSESGVEDSKPRAGGDGVTDLTDQVEGLNSASQEATNSAYDMWKAYTENDAALRGLQSLQDNSRILNQEQAAYFGIELDEDEYITVGDAIQQLIDKKRELEEPTVITAESAIGEIDSQIQTLKEALESGDLSQVDPVSVDLEVGEVPTEEDIKNKIASLEKDKVALALAFNIELNPDDINTLTVQFEYLNSLSMDKKEVSIETVGADTAMSTLQRINSYKIADKSYTVRENIISSGGGSGVQSSPLDNSGHYPVAVNGTAHAQGTGSWGAPKSETSLVGELGPELLVRGDRYTIVGQNGAEFTDVRKGDIIFNSKQTKSLLENGYVTGRGKAYAEGTIGGSAYASIDTWTNGYNKLSKDYSNTGNSASKLSKAADDLSKAADELSDDFEEIFDWIEVRIEEINETISLMSAKLENAIGSINQNAVIDDMIRMNRQLYDNLIAGANEYYAFSAKLLEKVPEQYREMAQDGTIAIESFTGTVGEEALTAIQDYREWVQKGADLTQQAEETLTEISNLAKQAIDNIASDYENKKSFSTIRMDQYEAYNALLETGAGAESAEIYKQIIKENNKNIATLQEQRNKMQAELNKQVEAGNIKKYSQNWYDAINDIAAVDTEIINLTKDTNDYQDTINELHWEHFDNLLSRIEAISNEADNLIDILGAKDLVDKDTAEWTDEGITSLGLYAQQMEVAEMQAKKYKEQINYLNKNWKKLGYTEQEYVEKLEELKEGQYDAIKAYNDTKDAIVDLNRERIDAIKSGIEKEIESYQKLIETKKEALESEKD